MEKNILEKKLNLFLDKFLVKLMRATKKIEIAEKMFFYHLNWTFFSEWFFTPRNGLFFLGNRQLGSNKTVVMRGPKMRALIENSEKNIVAFKNGLKTTIL